MKRVIILLIIFTGVLQAVLIESCKKNSNKPQTTPISLTIPSGFPPMKYNFTANSLTQEAFELGRKLFYDGRLSKDGNFPCASCHQQFAAFSTYDHALSHGYNNSFTTRNAPALFNLAWQKEFMHDGGINDIELQPIAQI